MSDKNARGITPMRAISSFNHHYRHYRRHLALVLDSYLSSTLIETGEITKKQEKSHLINAALRHQLTSGD
ncbi:hypothetical protein [Dickeya fangzhongdai]|uniref:hypothetical protein n=1 Tax=Dickeya fangzhongdai TaxID=1778540 RepID=UPI0026DF2E02|nr:hypothetical protein [Dickeya fangzhongdai]WKV51794.1 hypothetical protein PL145_06045 [Dickeya fangzhongdai]